MKTAVKYYLIVLCSLLLFSSCNKGDKIVVDDISQIFDDSMFRGVVPDTHFPEICEILGEPNEYLDIDGDEDEKEHSPIYYFENGKIICHWDGSKKWPIRAIDFYPFENKPMYVQDIFKVPISQFGITDKTKKLRLFQGNVLYYEVYLDNLRIKRIEYWMVKKKFLNVAW